MPQNNIEKISESEVLLQGTIDALTGYIAILDNRGNILKVNRAWSDLVGLNTANFTVGSNYIQACRDLSSDSIGAQLAQGITDVIGEKKNFFEIEYPYQSTTEKRWYITRVVPFGKSENLHIIVTHENITNRKFTEKALLESEKSYRILAETASDVIIKIDAGSKIIFINSACERVFGYEPAEMIGQSLTMIIPERLRKQHRSGIKRYLQTGKRNLLWESLELPALHKDGHIFPLEISFGEFKQDDTHYFIAVARDISERKQTEKATAHLAAIVESSEDAVISKDLEGIIRSWNKGAEKIFGYTAAEMVGKPILLLIPPYRIDEESTIIRRIKNGEVIQHYDTIRRRKDGSDINISLTVSPIRDDAGNIIGASKIARDITEKILADELLRENQTMLALAMQSSRMGAWERDVATGIVIWSEELEEIFGLEKGAFGQTLEAYNNLIYKDDRERIRSEVNQAIEEHREYTIEFRFYHADGSIRWMEGRGQAVYSQKGEPVRLYGIGIDITDRKRAEQLLIERESLATLNSDISLAIIQNNTLEEILQSCAETIVEHLDAAFARIWTLNEQENVLELQASAGLYTNLDGAHSRVPVGKFKIGLIAKQRRSHLTNSVVGDSRVTNQEWAEREGMVSFAGYPLLVGERLVGVVAMFSRHPLGLDAVKAMESAANIIALGIERKLAEETLRKSRGELERQSRIFDTTLSTINDYVYNFDRDGRFLYANKILLDLWNLKKEEAIGKTMSELNYPKEVETQLFDAVRKVFETGQTVTNETFYTSQDGSSGYYENVLSPFLAPDGTVEFVSGSSRDITERKQAQEALIKAERKAAEEYQALLARIVPLGQTLGTSRDLISVYRAVLEFVRTSMSCSGFFVSFYDSLNHQRIAAFVWGNGEEVDIMQLPPMPITELGGTNSQVILGKKTVITNQYWEHQKKRPHVVLQENGWDPQSSLVVPMMIKNEVIGTLEVQSYENEAFSREQAVALEMVANLAAVAVENVRLLEVEANARKAAEDANRAKDEFLSVLSHELRTPLNAMLGWIRMLKSGILDASRTSQAIETIERNARLQNNLIEDLLDVSRIISGKMLIEKEDVDIISIVKNSVENAAPAAQEKNIALMFESDFASQNLKGDSTRLQQIINNLLNNAIKFTPEGGAISVNIKRAFDKFQIEIIDTGIGISAEFLPMIFDRFKQADSTTKRSHSGLGLGLTIVRHLTELHGGTVKVLSQGENLGSTFIIEFPLATISKESLQAHESFIEIPHLSKLKGMKILLVDDDREGVQPLQILLETHQAEVHCAKSATDALKQISGQKFDVLVSDIGMPEMDGYELISEARKLINGKYFLPAIALTAYASTQDRERALTAGFQTHLSKPVDFEQFLSVLNNLLDNPDKE